MFTLVEKGRHRVRPHLRLLMVSDVRLLFQRASPLVVRLVGSLIEIQQIDILSYSYHRMYCTYPRNLLKIHSQISMICMALYGTVWEKRENLP